MSTEAGACERLSASRERLRHALHQVHSAKTSGANPEGLLGGLLGQMQAEPGAGLMMNLLQAWWQQQPMRVGLLLAQEATTGLLQPIAQRHPYRLVLAAAAVGGLTVVVRPWRWIPVSGLLAGLLPKVLSQVMKTLAPSQGQVAPDHRRG
jgi:hypothetical protein